MVQLTLTRNRDLIMLPSNPQSHLKILNSLKDGNESMSWTLYSSSYYEYTRFSTSTSTVNLDSYLDIERQKT